MNSSRPLLKATTATNAAAAAATRTRTRTRTRTARAKGDAPDAPGELIPPSRDLIGPPCPLSNLRPVYYAPLFPSLHSPSGWGDLAAATDTDADAAAAPLPSLWTAARGAAQTAATPPAPPPRRRLPRPRKPHPYSLAEFPTLSTTTTSSSSSRPRSSTTTTATTTTTTTVSSDPKLVRLERVRQRLHAQDLEWRWARYRFDAFNQAFWTRMNERFLRGREAYLLAAAADAATRADARPVDSEGRHGGGGGGRVIDRRKEGGDSLSSSSSSSSRPKTNPNSSSNSHSNPNPNPNPGVEGTQAVDLAPFYAQHLAETKRAYADYNKQLWRFQAGLIWPAVRASARSWRWRFEVWRAGGARDGR